MKRPQILEQSSDLEATILSITYMISIFLFQDDSHTNHTILKHKGVGPFVGFYLGRLREVSRINKKYWE